jgi:hypothetical protein
MRWSMSLIFRKQLRMKVNRKLEIKVNINLYSNRRTAIKKTKNDQK